MLTRLRIETVTLTLPSSLKNGILSAVKADQWMLDQLLVKDGDNYALRGFKTMLSEIEEIVIDAMEVEDIETTDPTKLQIPIYVGDGAIPSREVDSWLKIVASMGMMVEYLSAIVSSAHKYSDSQKTYPVISVAIYQQILSTMTDLRCLILSGFRQKYASLTQVQRDDIHGKLKSCLDTHVERRRSIETKLEHHQKLDTFYQSALQNIQP